MRIVLPRIDLIDESIAKNRIRQYGSLEERTEGHLAKFVHDRTHGWLFQVSHNNEETLILPRKSNLPDNYARIVQGSVDETADLIDLSDCTWLKHPLFSEKQSGKSRKRQLEEVLASWTHAFSYIEEAPEEHRIGLRQPQIGAVHAIHAHWAVSSDPATVVMPTGTGKTDTMLAILISARCKKVLVIVPSDALRTQLVDKFLSLGTLKAIGSTVLTKGARYPVVCSLKHKPSTIAEVNAIFSASQVIVTTSNIAGQCLPEIQDRIAHYCPYLFIDEAHHAEAPTWISFKEKFHAAKILQFTATPFREDGKSVDGKLIFNYPLKKAQQEGYFKPIRFKPIREFNLKKADKAIAEEAIKELRASAEKGHVLMARVSSVSRANEVFPLYAQYTEYNPVQLHTGITSKQVREETRRKLISGKSRIVVCVDMLGEGFDLPELKIAAFHDIRKTLAVTLQLAGRFTRSRQDLGDAVFIANTADIHVVEELKKLYSRDPDWNVLLPELSERIIGEQQALQDFLGGFTDFTKTIPLRTVRPATSTVIYKTQCDNWSPDKYREGIHAVDTCAQIYDTVNHAKHTLVVVTARRVPLVWTDVESLYNWDWELYVVIWSPEQNLLFINSSSNSGTYRALAKAIAGDSAVLVSGQHVFRTFSGINRLRLQNIGLTDILGRAVRYTAQMGSDVGPEVPFTQRRRSQRSVLSGVGYEDGKKTAVGASRKGRIWSHRRDRVDQLAAWCKQIGAKLLDETIDPDEVLKGTLHAEPIKSRPTKMPIYIDWPEHVYTSPEIEWSITIGDSTFSLSEVTLELVSPTEEGPLRFCLTAGNKRAELELELFEKDGNPDYRVKAVGDDALQVRHGNYGEADDAVEFFDDEPPVIWFADGSQLEGNQYVELKDEHPPFDANKITTWNWGGINIRKESQGTQKETDSIQARVIQRLREGNYHVIVDDDGSGEAADIVAIRLIGEMTAPKKIEVEFYHCKYSSADTPGGRITDLYEVCGQAQKSIYWKSTHEKTTDLFTHLLRREAMRQDAGASTRIEVGSTDLLDTLREISHMCEVTLKIFVVQPGLSKAQVTQGQLRLLSVTENHLHETYRLPFGVIASA